MQPKSMAEDEADSAKKVQRLRARANKQKPLQTPSPQQRPFLLSNFLVGDTQPRLHLVSNGQVCCVDRLLKLSHLDRSENRAFVLC